METDRGHLVTGADRPARHKVLSLEADRAGGDPGHSHVVGVETAAPDGARRWHLVEFVEAVRLGERFYLHEGSATIEVEPTVCVHCSKVTITSVVP